MDRQKVTSPGDRKFSTGNEEEAFLTKTDVKRAWEKKEKLKKMATANLPVITEKVIEAKPHSEKLQEKIDSIRRYFLYLISLSWFK